MASGKIMKDFHSSEPAVGEEALVVRHFPPTPFDPSPEPGMAEHYNGVRIDPERSQAGC